MFGLTFDTDNAAFTDPHADETDQDRQDAAAAAEIARILRRVAVQVESHGKFDGGILDANGNRIGSFNWEIR